MLKILLFLISTSLLASQPNPDLNRSFKTLPLIKYSREELLKIQEDANKALKQSQEIIREKKQDPNNK